MSAAGRAPLMSVVVNFHDMPREAERTLFTLSAPYQRDVSPADYEVLVVDHGSRRALDPGLVARLGEGFSYHHEATDAVSPCRAINAAARRARGEYVVLMIDGARMLSPGILGLMTRVARMHERCFVYTLIMHLGPDLQCRSMLRGYDQRVEDEMLAGIDWRADGYRLFGVSSLGDSSAHGYLGHTKESGCFMLRRRDFLELGGYSESFVCPGGGLVNLDLFNVIRQQAAIQPVMLLGEATFHQFHGGVATNALPGRSPWDAFAAEYERIRGASFRSVPREPLYVGSLRPESLRFLHGPAAGPS